jgi:hypothetical protein
MDKAGAFVRNWHKEILADTDSLGSAGLPLILDQTSSGARRWASRSSNSQSSSSSAPASAVYAILSAVACSLLRFIASRLSNDALDTARPDARSTSRLALQNPSSASRSGRTDVL